MTCNHGVMVVDVSLADRLDRMCSECLNEPPYGETVFDQEFVFKDGFRMAIQVYSPVWMNGESGWSQGVLFDSHGEELGVTGAGEVFVGTYIVEVGDDTYMVEVIADEDVDVKANDVAEYENPFKFIPYTTSCPEIKAIVVEFLNPNRYYLVEPQNLSHIFCEGRVLGFKLVDARLIMFRDFSNIGKRACVSNIKTTELILCSGSQYNLTETRASTDCYETISESEAENTRALEAKRSKRWYRRLLVWMGLKHEKT